MLNAPLALSDLPPCAPERNFFYCPHPMQMMMKSLRRISLVSSVLSSFVTCPVSPANISIRQSPQRLTEMNNYDPLTPSPSYGCHLCPAAFVSPAARLHHLEQAHNDKPDTSGGQAAVARLQDILARSAARHALLLARKAARTSGEQKP